MNFLLKAFSRSWASIPDLREAYDNKGLNDEELVYGVTEGVITKDQYKEITGKEYKA
jgi:uncharacterized XkdX family phage protein